MTRTAFFNLLGGVIIGLAAGLFYTRVVNPVKYVDVSPDTLGADYKTDYAVMIAHAYAADANLDLARARLATLRLANPAQFIADTAAQQSAVGAPPADLRVLNALATALGAAPPPLP